MGGKQTTNTYQKQDPWAPAQPALNTALQGAQDAFNNTYQGTGVAAKDPLVQQGQDLAVANANSGAMTNLGTSAINNVNSTLGNGGLTGQQSLAQLGIGGALGGFGNAMGQATSALNPYVSGQYLSQPNPYMKQAVGNAMQDAADAVNGQFSAAGRYGSGAQSAALGKQLGNIATNAYMGDYNQQQQNQLGAINSMGNLASTGLNGALSGFGAIGGIGQQGFNNNLSAASGATALQGAQNADANNLAQIGSQNMAYNQQLIDAQNQNPWTKVGNLAQIAGGIGGLGGTSSGTSTTEQSGGLPILGGVLGGLGALKNLGGLSGLSSLFTLSDERAKDDVEKVGELDNGLNVYSYHYKGDDTPQIGLLAQEVEKKVPSAVRTGTDGLKRVNYHAATRKMGARK